MKPHTFLRFSSFLAYKQLLVRRNKHAGPYLDGASHGGGQLRREVVAGGPPRWEAGGGGRRATAATAIPIGQQSVFLRRKGTT